MNKCFIHALKICPLMQHKGTLFCQNFVKSFSIYTIESVFQMNKYNNRILNAKAFSKQFPTSSESSDAFKQHFSTVSIKNTNTKDANNMHVPSFYDRYIFPEPPGLVSDTEHDTVIEEVNNCIANPDQGRLFAIVLFGGVQFKVTDNDLIRTTGRVIGVELGDRIRLEKVLLIGGQDFTLVGKPLLRRSLAKVEATVIEKTPSADKVLQYFKPRKKFQRRHIITNTHVVLRINSVEAYPALLS